MLQAGGSDSFALHLSGVTPGELGTKASHHEKVGPPCGRNFTQDWTRWSIVPLFMEPIDRASLDLARVILAGPFTFRAGTQRLRQALGRCPR